MAKTKLNPVVKKLSGSIGDIIFKHYAYGNVLSKRPDMSGIKATPAQRLQRDRMRCSALFYRQILARPELKEAYTAVAAARGLSVRATITQEYMRRSRQEGQLVVPVGPPRGTIAVTKPEPAVPAAPSQGNAPAGEPVLDAGCW